MLDVINDSVVSRYYDRFIESYVPVTESGCWLWLGSIGTDGLGYLCGSNGEPKPKAHRFSWYLKNGPIVRGMAVRSRCGLKICINPDHLYLQVHRSTDLTGKVFGRLTVLRDGTLKIGKGRVWECLCECGTVTFVTTMNLHQTVSCGCIRSAACVVREMNKKHPDYNGVLRYYKRNAKTRGLEWNVSSAAFEELINGNCRYCDAVPKNRLLTGRTIRYNGIDRVDNSLGYIDGNVVPCCSVCNFAKNNMPLSDFLSWIKRVYDKNIKDI